MKTVTIRKMTLGRGMPKVCVSIVGKNRKEILEQAETIHFLEVDMVEWRADYFDQVKELEEVEKTAQMLREILQDLPLLFTFRSKKEGGETVLSPKIYEKLCVQIACSGLVDMIDVELFMDLWVDELVKKLHRTKVKVILSNHDFQKTPEKEEIINRLLRMQDFGADILKIAVMPQSPEDVLTLLSATYQVQNGLSERPIITMSMGKMGAISRIAGETFGSAVTFGSIGMASAPGQIPVKQLRDLLHTIYEM